MHSDSRELSRVLRYINAVTHATFSLKFVSLFVLVIESPSDSKHHDNTDRVADNDNGPRNSVPWLVFVEPPNAL
jgi:hypothetical protein